MADDLARRREIRRRKILESSEDRLKRITSNTNKKPQEQEKFLNIEHEVQPVPPLQNCFSSDLFKSNEHSVSENVEELENRRLNEKETLSSSSSNGDFPRTASPDSLYVSYTFPKKVSDAETRSVGRTRSDARRNSSCTQMMMETLQFSSFSQTVLRIWLTAITAALVKMYFLVSADMTIFQAIFVPYIVLEITLFGWSKLEAQVYARPVASPVISGILLLCGFSSNVINAFNTVWNTMQSSITDFCVYIFSFVFMHFIFEICM